MNASTRPRWMKHTSWAANREPDIVHKGRRVWLCCHSHQPRILLQYWYSEFGPRDVNGFDVRTVPGYSVPAGIRPFSDAETRWHRDVIIAAIDSGHDLQAISDAHWAREHERQEEERLRRANKPFDPEIPF